MVTTHALMCPSLSGGGPTVSPASLTCQEVQVLRLAANGTTNRGIGRQLWIREDTVKSRMRSILRKLHAADRAQAVAIGFCLGLITSADIRIPRTSAPRGSE
ncbi:helix-turn-helix transcriptional regulator [Streptomyces sp. NPDC047985]|uniref:response regulator transcription factor n=1 Tax=Streptomyces sp. NPDC047985 TaxID=3155384 RepID=UPI00342FC979